MTFVKQSVLEIILAVWEFVLNVLSTYIWQAIIQTVFSSWGNTIRPETEHTSPHQKRDEHIQTQLVDNKTSLKPCRIHKGPHTINED